MKNSSFVKKSLQPPGPRGMLLCQRRPGGFAQWSAAALANLFVAPGESGCEQGITREWWIIIVASHG